MVLTAEGIRTDCALVLRISGRIDSDSAGELDQACHQWLTPGDTAMILDLSEVAYISSAGLSSVLKAGKQMDRQEGRLLICGLSPRLKQVFVFAGFDALFPIFDTREAALQDCQEKSLGKTS
jgi:anti-anti-sigma factor